MIISRVFRQIRSISYGLLHDVKPILYDHWQLSFSHGTRACFFFSCCEVEMFFSLLSCIFYCNILPIRGAKLETFFQLNKR